MFFLYFYVLGFKVVVDPPIINAYIGENVTFKCTVEPLALLETISIFWTKSISQKNFTSMRTLKLTKVILSDAGDYICTGESGGKISTDTGKDTEIWSPVYMASEKDI